jgi:uncharacterized membrane protein YfcA
MSLPILVLAILGITGLELGISFLQQLQQSWFILFFMLVFVLIIILLVRKKEKD